MSDNDIKNRFIKNFEIRIGQDAIGGMPVGETFVSFIINDRFCTCRLKDLKQWIDTIVASDGNRKEKAYEAKKHLDQFFADLLYPWMKLPELP